MTTRYVYLDITKVNTVYSDDVDSGNGAWFGTFDTGGSSQKLLTRPTTGSTSASAYVDEDFTSPTDNDYWFTPSDFISSGFANLVFEAIALNPSSIDLVLRTQQPADFTIQNIYLFYYSGNNPGMPTERYYLASGYISPYTFSSGAYATTTLALTKTNDSNCDNYLASGIPEIEFEFSKPDSTAIPEILPSDHRISTLALFTSGSALTLSTNSNIPLYMWGHSTAISGVDLYMSGIGFTTSIQSLYIQGHIAINSGLSLYTAGHLASTSGIDLYISGYPGSTSGSIPLYMLSFLTSSSGLSLYTQGIGSGITSMPLYLRAAEAVSSSGNINLNIWGTTNSGLFSFLPMSLNVDSIPTENTLPLYMYGDGYLGRVSGTMPLVLSITQSVSTSVDLVLWNSSILSSGFFPLYITTPSGTEGAIPASSTMPLVIYREFDGIDGRIPMSISGPILDSGTIPLYIICSEKMSSGNFDLFTRGQDLLRSYNTLYTHGF